MDLRVLQVPLDLLENLELLVMLVQRELMDLRVLPVLREPQALLALILIPFRSSLSLI
jgi:hypothetical protein